MKEFERLSGKVKRLNEYIHEKFLKKGGENKFLKFWSLAKFQKYAGDHLAGTFAGDRWCAFVKFKK